MSWDSKTLVVLIVTWAASTLIYATAFDMPEGTRSWAAGTALFVVILLGLWWAERRGARRGGAGDRTHGGDGGA